jgi:predicted nucleotidyltransferase
MGKGGFWKQVIANTNVFPRAWTQARLAVMTTMQALAGRRPEILRLAALYRAREMRVFGSVARGDATEGSDLDLLIKPEPGCSLFDLGGLLEDLQELLGCRVDLVIEDGLKPRLRERVLREAIPL